AAKALEGANVFRQRRRPGGVYPSAVFSGRKVCAALACGRHPTEARQVVPNPRISAGSTVVLYWLRLFRSTSRSTTGKNADADLKKLRPTLDIESHINAAPQPLPEAGARHKRTLEAVGCRRWFGRVGTAALLPTSSRASFDDTHGRGRAHRSHNAFE